ncbi:MAG TPA: isoleucine--tRNA ligase [Mycobacteriales bacterium]|nr:isoleucine--tRNA ligase [Mycobacteriales bacterium]
MTTRPRPFRPLPAHVDLPALERDVLARWQDSKVFQRSLERTAQGPLWVFYEGPPTANGRPGTHHIEARVFKDVFPRFKTMKGYHVPRRAGWDCHGLPVEIAVESELGFTGKKDIEAFGIAEFNARCRASVERHVNAFERMSERMGHWADYAHAYRTMDADYVEAVWWSLKQIHAGGLLQEDYRVAPYCPRCGTGLSDHEVAQGYETVTDPSVFVRFPVTSGPWAGRADLLVWTTTPWTLVSNTAVAVHPDVTYVVARDRRGTFVVAEPLYRSVLGEDAEVLDRMPGRALEHTSYARPFDLVDIPGAHFVIVAGYVTTEDGTGLVHQAPAFGADDLAAIRRYGLPVVNPIEPDGHFRADVPLVGGMFFKAADRPLADDLAERGLLLRELPYTHAYPHCWRCHTPLMYYALPSWYIRTTAIKAALIRENEATTWYPETIKHGRYGDWLDNNVDWALSRDRYWGTPLPIWRCGDGHQTCVESRAELSGLAGRDLSGLDPHRPYVDEVTFDCPTCRQPATRVPQVIDGWYDSGSMPFAQWGAPHHNRAEFEASYPADFIAEAIDQTRGWFYTLMAVGTLVFDRSSYRNVLCLGHIVAEDGRKMSKHLGNILEPMPLMDRHGADAVRWFMLCAGSPWASRRIGHAVLEEIVRKVLLTYWNTASFFTLYASTGGFDPATESAPDPTDRPLLDRWALAEAAETVAEVDDALERFDTLRAGRRLAQFVDDLSNWYVRRSRRRFWNADRAALHTLHECLDTLTRLMAPFVPFVTDAVWKTLVADVLPGSPDSVHLAAWPQADPRLRDADLRADMALVRRLVELGRAARAGSGVRTRQPLGRALVAAPGFERLPGQLRAEIAEELNVGSLSGLGGVAGVEGPDSLVDVRVKPNFRSLGKRFGPRTRTVAEAVTGADAPRLAGDLRTSGSASLTVDGEQVTLSAEDVLVTETPRSGWAVATEGGETVALDLTITPELRRAGIAREVVRTVQEARKAAGLSVTDRIRLWWQADGEVAEALREHGPAVAEEVLAVEFTEGMAEPDEPDAVEQRVPDLGLSFALHRA